MEIKFGKTVDRLGDTIVSAIFRQVGEFTELDVLALLDALCKTKEPNECDRLTIRREIRYYLDSFSLSDRIRVTRPGFYILSGRRPIYGMVRKIATDNYGDLK